MKTILTLAALLGALATPALAGGEAGTIAPTPAAEASALLLPLDQAKDAAAQPQSGPVQVVPLSATATPDMPQAAAKKSGGCSHGSTTYLTN